VWAAFSGGIRVELQQPDGQPIPGFSLDYCQEVFGDADLFSFQFGP